MPDSNGLVGASPAAVSSAACAALSCQSLFPITIAPLPSRNSKVGLASALGTPRPVRLGPIPAHYYCGHGPLLPPSMKPAITMLSPVLTKARVLMLPSFEPAPGLRS